MAPSPPLLPQLLTALVGLGLVAIVLSLGRVFATFPGDEWVLSQLRGLQTGWLDGPARVASAIGIGGIGWGGVVPWIPLAAFTGPLLLRRWADAAFLAAATLAPVVNLGLKELVARPRPDPALAMVQETGYSYPSGHAVFAAAFFGALMLVVYRSSYLAGRRRLRWAVLLFLPALILAVGLSRVYLGVHWASDVVAGFLVGAAYLAALDAVRRHLNARLVGGTRPLKLSHRREDPADRVRLRP